MKTTKIRLLIAFHMSILLLGLFLIYFLRSHSFGPTGNSIYITCAIIAIQFIFSLVSWVRYAGSLFNPYIIFFVCTMAFCGGRLFLELLNLNEMGIEIITDYYGNIIFSFNYYTILQALVLVSISLSGLQLGSLIVLKREKIRTWPLSEDNDNDQGIRLVGSILFILSIAPTIFLLYNRFKLYRSAGYMSLYQQEVIGGLGGAVEILSRCFIPGVFFSLVAFKNNILVRRALLVISIIYVLILLLTGSRIWPFMYLIAFVWLWDSYINPVSKVFTVLVVSVLILVIFPTIAIIRNDPDAMNMTLSGFVSTYLSIKNPIIKLFNEISGTIGTICHTINLIPSERNYDFGVGYLYALSTIIPNILWRAHPSITHGLYSDWLTLNIDPWTYKTGGSFGFSFIAEAYANFGILGVALISGICGSGITKYWVWAKKTGNKAVIASLATFMAFLIIYIRGESAFIFRALVWYALIPMFVARSLSRKSIFKGKGQACLPY